MIPAFHVVYGYMQTVHSSPGDGLASFMLSVRSKFHPSGGGDPVEKTTWWDVYCTGKNAGIVARNGSKGRRVMVRSERIEPEVYTVAGVQYVKIVAYNSSVTFLDPREDRDEVDQD